MPKITYIAFSGAASEVVCEAGVTVMQAARDQQIDGIDALCGGACACATCQVYVDAAWQARTGTRSPMEQTMLEFAENVQEHSRLSCQIIMTAELDGLVVRMPETQQP